MSTALQSPGLRARATVRKPEASTSCFAKAFPKAFGEPFPKGLPKPFPKGIDTVRRGVRPVELHCVPRRCIALHVVAGVVNSTTPVVKTTTPQATRKPSWFLPETQWVTESVTPVTKSVTPSKPLRSPFGDATVTRCDVTRDACNVTCNGNCNAPVTLAALHPFHPSCSARKQRADVSRRAPAHVLKRSTYTPPRGR